VTGRALLVEDAGPLTTVQDLGRPGWAHLGVPHAGALDAPSAALVNRLVGNGPDAALLETTLGGATVRTTTAMTVAVAGAECEVRVDGRSRPFAAALAVNADQVVEVGPARSGVRSYLAVAGGVTVEPVLGSRSTDTLAGIGPAALRDGDLLPVGPASGVPSAAEAHLVRRTAAPVVLRFRPGPRVDRFAPDACAVLGRAVYSVDARSNRVGLRLDGEPVPRDAAEVPTEGIVLGAVQVPPSGLPLVFLADHPTTGGYPVLGTVALADLPACAQLRPGQQVRFVVD
jgi:biotin-dependent carboxylase-like uncharacterized protein